MAAPRCLPNSCLLAAYGEDPARARHLALAELGRALPDEEWRQWQAGIARPGALLLGEAAEAAEPLLVHSAWLASEIAARYGRVATIVPHSAQAWERASPGIPPLVAARASGLAAESCVWALELLQFWGLTLHLNLVCSPAERDQLRALAARLGVAAQLGFGPAPGAALGLFLGMRGQSSVTSALADAAATGLRCIASRCVLESTAAPDWVHSIPDQPSPPLLAETIRRGPRGLRARRGGGRGAPARPRP